MSDYQRATHECAPAQLKPALLQAVRAYAGQHSLGNVDPFHDTALLLTPAWLVWARSGPKSGTVVAAARLRETRVSAFESKLIPDTGLEVQTPVAGSPEPVVAFIPLGPELADSVVARVKAAVANAA